jgi:tRNA A-37 threonylcarbamoyl transferase component Bud32
MKIEPGSRFGDAVVDERIGEGAMGVVWSATWRGERAVVKFPHVATAATSEFVARLEREAAALRSIQSENVVKVLAVGCSDEGVPYVVLERVDGPTLRALVEQAPRALSPEGAAKLLDGLAAALEAAHRAGVVHRDVKPENVMLEDDVVKLVDFGLAKPREDVAKLTATGAPLGTPAYMAPEQWWNDGVGPAADQYAFGLVAFELLTGAPAFPQTSLPELMEAHLHREPPAIEGAPERVSAAIRRMLAKKPSDRFPSMSEARVALREALGGVKPRRAPRILPWALALLLPIVLFAFGYPGARDPRASIPLAGWAIFGVFGAYAVGAALLRRSWIPAMLPAFLGTFATYTGWQVVLASVAKAAPNERVPLVHEGLYEANVNRFFGLGLSAALFFALAASIDAKTLRSEAERVGALFVAMAFTLGAAAIRLRSATDLVWTTGAPRGARVAEIVAQQHVAEQTRPIAVATLVTVSVYLGYRLLRRLGAPRDGIAVLRSIGRVPAFALFAWIFVDGAMLVRLREHIADVMAPQRTELELMAQLDPPSAEGLPPAPVAPALKIARDRVLVDDAPVGLTSALEGGGLDDVLRADLSHRLARDGDGAASLVLLADRNVATAAVARALRVAASVGVTEVFVLFTRGPSPELAGATGEIAATLPSDFGALRVALTPAVPDLSGATWEATAEALRRANQLSR